MHPPCCCSSGILPAEATLDSFGMQQLNVIEQQIDVGCCIPCIVTDHIRSFQSLQHDCSLLHFDCRRILTFFAFSVPWYYNIALYFFITIHYALREHKGDRLLLEVDSACLISSTRFFKISK
jgi:hypothetical protein